MTSSIAGCPAPRPSRRGFVARLDPGSKGFVRMVLIPLLLAGCSNAPERTPIEPASTATDSGGGLAATIGIAAGTAFIPILVKGCSVPCSATQIIQPASPAQTSIAFELYQSAGSDLATAHPLGTYRISWAAEANAPAQVHVVFTVDSAGAFLEARAEPGGRWLEVTRAAPKVQ